MPMATGKAIARACHVNRGDEEEIREIENYSGEEGPSDVGEVGREADVVEEAGGAVGGGAHG